VHSTALEKFDWSHDSPVGRLLVTGTGGEGRFPQILDLFQGSKTGVPGGCLTKTSIFKIIMTDDVTLWSKLESTW